jgi:hypothetical protein
MLIFALALPSLAGCKYTFDGDASQIAFSSDPPPAPTARFSQNRASTLLGVDVIRVDPSGDRWMAGRVLGTSLSIGSIPPTSDGGLDLTPVDAPGPVVSYRANWVLSGERYVYLLDAVVGAAAPSLQLRIVPVGATEPVRRVTLEAGPVNAKPGVLVGENLVALSRDGSRFAWRGSALAHFLLSTFDGSAAQTFALPNATFDPLQANLGWDCNGRVFLLGIDCPAEETAADPGQACSHLLAYSIERPEPADLGRVRSWGFDCAANAVVTCSRDGLKVRAIDAASETVAPPRLLDGEACAAPLLDTASSVAIGVDGDVDASAGLVFYERLPRISGEDATLWGARVDGTGAPRRYYEFHNPPIDNLERLGAPGAVVGHGSPFENARDGWLGDWQFRERGRSASFSRDATRLRFLEHTARDYPSGDLLSSTIADHAVLRLANNVYDFDELPDGRVVAADQQAFRGAQNRVVVIDEATRTGRVVAESADAFDVLPASGRHPAALLVHYYSAADDANTGEVGVVDLPPR